MTFDLGVWQSAGGLDAFRASQIYAALCRGELVASGLVAGAGVRSFSEELFALWPAVENTARVLDNCVLLSCNWADAETALLLVVALAGKHGLVVFEPQSEELYLPEVQS